MLQVGISRPRTSSKAAGAANPFCLGLYHRAAGNVRQREQEQAPPRSSPRSGGPPAPRTAGRADQGANAEAGSGRRGSARRDITDFDASGLTQRELVRKVQDLAQHINDQRRLLDQARITREREQRVSEETRRKLREAQEELDRLAERARELEEVQKNLEARNAELEAIAAASRRVLDWDTLMDPDSMWSSKINQLTGLRNAAILKAVFEWVDCGGVSSRLKTWHHAQSVDRMRAVESDEAQRKSSGHSDKLRSPQNCFLLTLCKLRTGLSFAIISGWFQIPYTECVRIFSTWIPYMARFFRAEFPVPTQEELEGRVDPSWEHAYGAPIRLVPDASEFAMECPSSKMAARTVWSEYKQRHTIKILACICPSGAYV